jgi:eukaryotic-like serine/threonine-protein kinase
MPFFPPATKVVRFGLFELNVHEGELRKNGLKLKLLGQPLQILTILVRRRGEVVAREELRAELWPTDTFVDFDHGLNNAIQKIREALGESAANPQFIETVPRRGYRFLPSLEVSFESAGLSANGGLQEGSSRGLGPVAPDGKTEIVETKLAQSGRSGRRAGLAWFCAVVALAVTAALLFFRELPQQAAMIYSQIAPPEGTGFSSALGYNTTVPVVSPDGKNLVFTASGPDNTSMLWVRPIGSPQARQLSGTEHAYGPFWSPDSKSMGFFALGKLKTIGLNNDNPIVVCPASSGARGGSWGTDGTILFAPGPRTPIFRVAAKGGLPLAVTKIDESKHGSHRWPFILPDGKHFVYLAVNFLVPAHDEDGIYYASLDGKENRLLLKAHRSAEYASGFLLFVRDGILLAQSFDPVNGKLRGETHPIAEKVAEDAPSWKSVISVSPAGMLAYAPAEAVHNTELTWFDQNGKQLGNAGAELKGQLYRSFRISPQGDRVAVGMETGLTDVWVTTLGQRDLVRLTFQENSIMPVWSPDGKWISFLSYTGHWKISRRASDGTGKEEDLLESSEALWPLSWCPDGTCLLYANMENSEYHLRTLPLGSAQKPIEVATTGDRAAATFSPDGRWIAYASNETGKAEIYLMTFDRGPGKWQISRNGGTNPVWAARTDELFYLASDNMLTVVSVKEIAGKLQVGLPRPLFRIAGSGYFDVPSGAKKILVGIAGVPNTRPVNLIVNWAASLKK